ncbi:hypothetical protein [Mycobacterium sp. NAZ190054]|uniref:hypothetical protein n=1 Tax=Mycobacterium sp. NAZ190054 TaxID=1747766 RepID=UPI000AD30200|nr:hypothetical protein [Mycobacterium sp. NAZ190054]
MPGTAPCPGVYVELVSVTDDDYGPWGSWYDTTYRTARANVPGVVSVRRCRGVVGSAPAMVVYDLDDFTVPYSAEWRAADAEAATAGPAPVPAPSFDDVDGRVYRQIFTSSDVPYTAEPTAILHGAFFEVPSRDQDEFNDWYNTEHVEFVKIVDGYLNCRRFQGLDNLTKFLALYDVVSVDHSDAKNVHPQNFTPWANRVRAKLPTYRERRLFRVDAR